MADLKTILNALYRGAFPQANEEDINNKIQLHLDQPDSVKDLTSKLVTEPQAQEKQEQIEANPDEPKAPLTNTATDPFALNIPSANTVSSTGGDFQEVSSGMQPTTKKMEGQVGNVMPPSAPPSVNPEIPALENKMIPSATPEPSSFTPSTKEASTGTGKTKEKNPLDVLTQTNQDYEARQKFQDEERKRHMLGLIPQGLAGVGDAISNAASAFGAKGKTGATEAVQATLQHGEKLRKDQFDQKLVTDPNSEISQHYREILGMMMGKKPNDPQIAHLSAEQIKQTMPEVEKFMAKELQLKAIAAQKEIGLSEKQSQFDDRQWERLEAKTNQLNAGSRKALGVAASANMRADRIIELAQDAKNVTPQDIQNAIADMQGIFKGGVPDQIMLQHGNYPSLIQELQKIKGIITNTPAAANSPAIMNRLVTVTKEIKQVDNAVISNNLGVNEIVFKRLIEKDPTRWEEYKRRVLASTIAPSDTEAAKPGAAQPTEAPGVKKEALSPNEEIRIAKDGRKIVYDITTKKPLRVYGK